MPSNPLKNKAGRGKENFAGMKVLVMGLGLHGGGLESALYLAKRGAEVTVTDLRDEKTLAPSIEKLKGYPIRYVLGRHEVEDFQKADMVVKNPGVRSDSPFLKAARRLETDISLFLSGCCAFGPRILAVTGSKGKSSTASALYHVLGEGAGALGEGKAWLGGNISLSPLSFLDELDEKDTVVLELSSWQLGDMAGNRLLKPRAAVITPIMRDHMDRYPSMEAYVADKRLIYKNQDKADVTVARDDDWGRSFLHESQGRPLLYSEKPLDETSPGGWISSPEGPAFARLWEGPGQGGVVELVPAKLLVPGLHQKQNLLAAALALLDLGLEADFIRESLGRFPGVEHRLELFHERNGVKFYNDSAATIPEAAAAAVYSFEKPGRKTSLVLVTGGTDKNLDFTPLALAADKAKSVILLEGTGSEKLKKLLDEKKIRYRGPYDSVGGTVKAAFEEASPGDEVVFSPGCTSFGMFINEFDRGLKWKEGVRNYK